MLNQRVRTLRYCHRCRNTTQHVRGPGQDEWECVQYGHPKGPRCCYLHMSQGGECDGEPTHPLPSNPTPQEEHKHPRK